MPDRASVFLLALLMVVALCLLGALWAVGRDDDLLAFVLALMGGVALRGLGRALRLAEAGR